MNSNASSIYNFKLFLRKNLKVLLGSILFTVILAIIVSIVFYRPAEEVTVNEAEIVEDTILPTIENSQDVKELTPEELELTTKYLNSTSYAFRIYVENEDGSTFTNNQLLNQIFVDDLLLDEMRNQTNRDFIIDEELSLSVAQINGPNMIQITIRTGNEQYNQDIANFYYNYINDGNVDIFQNKQLYFIDRQPIPYNEMYFVEDEEEAQTDTGINLEVIVIVSVLGAILGLIAGVVISLIKENMSSKIPSVFNFDLYKDIPVVNLDSIKLETTDQAEKVVNQALQPHGSNNLLILTETPLSNHLLSNINETSKENTNTSFVNATNMELISLNQIDEVVVAVQVYVTSKDWFEKQMEQVKILDVPVKIIRLPFNGELYES